jgi:hypothetical protein
MSDIYDDLPHFKGEFGAHGVLIDHAFKRDEKRDFADSDVRSAMKEVAANENRHRTASELGAEGMRAAEAWDYEIERHGPNTALHAAQLYARQPRLPTPPEDIRESDDDHMSAARRALHQAKAKAEREATMPAALDGYDRLVNRHGTPEVIEKYKRFDALLKENPYENGPRVAQEIANFANDNAAMIDAHKTVRAYERKHKLSADEREIMQEALLNGHATNMASAHEYAKYALAMDIEPRLRDTVSATRRLEGAETYFMNDAKAIVAEWDSRHPNVGGETRDRMRYLLMNGLASDLDDAYAKARK